MFSLIYGFVEYICKQDEFHVLILGLDKAGKTNVLEKLKTLLSDMAGLDASKIMATVGLNVGRFEAFNTSLVFWDLGGAASLRSIWEKYYADTHAIMYVVDAADVERLDEAKAALDKVLGCHDLMGAPLLVVANKQDVEGAANMADIAEAFGLGKLDSRPVIVQPASAYSGKGLSDGLKWLVEAVKRSPRRHLMTSPKK